MDCDGLTLETVSRDVQCGVPAHKSEFKDRNVTKVPNLTTFIVVLDGNPRMSNSWKMAVAVACTISAQTLADSVWHDAGEKPRASNSSKKTKTRRFMLPRTLAEAKAISRYRFYKKHANGGAAFIADADNNSLEIVPRVQRTGWTRAGSKKSWQSLWNSSQKKQAPVSGVQFSSEQQPIVAPEMTEETDTTVSDYPETVTSSAANTESDKPTQSESKESPSTVLNVSHRVTLSGDDTPATDSIHCSTKTNSDKSIVSADSKVVATPAVEIAATDDTSQSDYLQQLQELVHDDDDCNTDGPMQQRSYLSDLNRLITGDSKWLLSKDELLDLEPGTAEPILMSGDYLSDLLKLVAGMPTGAQEARFASASEDSERPYQLAYDQNASPPKYYEIPRSLEAECREPGHDPNSADIRALFTPLHAIQLAGHSTAPPTLPEDAENVSLALPQDSSCQRMVGNAPAYYHAHGYGVRRAPRNTHQFRNNPIYFEDPNLERCGRSKGCLTTACSTLHFAAQIATMPYKATVNHPSHCVAALPDCPTCHQFGSDAYIPKWSWKAAAVQAAAVTGTFYAIP